MSEPTLTPAYADLRRATGLLLSIGRDPAAWSAEQIADVASFIQDGLNQMLTPPVPGGYQWQFLRTRQTLDVWPTVDVDATVTVTGVHAAGSTTITATAASFYRSMIGQSIVVTTVGTFTITGYTSSTVITVSGDATASAKTFSIASTGNYRLADSYAGIDSDLNIVATSTRRGHLTLTNERMVERRRNEDSESTGVPRLAAVRPVTLDMTIGQRWELCVYPIPDLYYEVEYRGQVNRDTLTASNIYAVGAPYSLCLKESVLSCAERSLHNVEGPHFAAFMRQLSASIDYDRRAHGARHMGQNLDRSDERDVAPRQTNYVTFNGVQYGPN